MPCPIFKKETMKIKKKEIKKKINRKVLRFSFFLKSSEFGLLSKDRAIK